MDNHGEFSPLDRSRLLAAGGGGADSAGGAGGGAGGSGSGGAGTHPLSVTELASRAATPTTVSTLAGPYHGRFGLPSALPGPNFALVNSFLSGAHSAEARKALLPDLQHYWGAHAQGFPRYLMAGGLYPPYPSLFSGPESLSLLGAGVACVSGGGAPGPSQSAHHVAQCQRLLEMQKEAYLASVSAASHHQALYGMAPGHLPPFLEPPPSSSSSSSSSSAGGSALSLVKQEPKELSCSEKARQAERRKSEAEHRARELTLAAALPSRTDLPLKEPKLSPSSLSSPSSSSSSSVTAPSVSPSSSSHRRGGDKRVGGSSTSPGSSGALHGQKSSSVPSYVAASSGVLVARQPSDASRAKCMSPGGKNTAGASSSSLTSSTALSSGSATGSQTGQRSPRTKSGPVDSGKKASRPEKSLTASTSLSPNQTSLRSGSALSASVSPSSVSEVSLHVDVTHSAASASPSPSTWEVPSAVPAPLASGDASIAVGGDSAAIAGVPTQTAPPVALATVQHDGMLLSALASPSSAAASSAPAKPATIKQHTGGMRSSTSSSTTSPSSAPLATTSGGVAVGGSSSSTSSQPETRESETEVDTTLPSVSGPGRVVGERRSSADTRWSPGDRERASLERAASRSRAGSSGSCEIVVDSTENEEEEQSPLPGPCGEGGGERAETSRAIEETIRRVASAADTAEDNDPDLHHHHHHLPHNNSSSGTSNPGATASSVTATLSAVVVTSVVPSAGSAVTSSPTVASSTRTVYAKTQPVPSVSATGTTGPNVSPRGVASHGVGSRGVSSALPYYHTLYSVPAGAKKVHATTYVPEVGVFKGPNIKAMAKQASATSSSSSSVSPAPSVMTSSVSPSGGLTVSVTLGDGPPKSEANPASLSPNPTEHGGPALSWHPPASVHLSPREPKPSVDSSLSPVGGVAGKFNSSNSAMTSHVAEISSSDTAGRMRPGRLTGLTGVPLDVDSGGDEDDDDSDSDERHELVIDDERDSQEKSRSRSTSPAHAKSRDDIAEASLRVSDERGKQTVDLNLCPPTGAEPLGLSDSLGRREVLGSLTRPSAVGKSSQQAIDYSLPREVAPKHRRHVGLRTSALGKPDPADARQDASKRNVMPSSVNVLNSKPGNSSTPESVSAKVHSGTVKSVPDSSKAITTKIMLPSRTKPLPRPAEVGKPSPRRAATSSSAQTSAQKKRTPHPMSSGDITSKSVADKARKRLRLPEDASPSGSSSSSSSAGARCGSAPPSAMPLAPSTPTNTSSPAHVEAEGTGIEGKSLDSSSSHGPGPNIPVGIAVAQIRPQLVEVTTDSAVGGDDPSRDGSVRGPVVSVSSPGGHPTGGATLPPNLVVAGAAVNASPWLPQMPFSLHQSLNAPGATYDPAHNPFTAPAGFKFAQDSLTGHILLIPNSVPSRPDFVDHGTVWPGSAANFAPPTGAGQQPFASGLATPTITISGPEGKEGRAQDQQKAKEKSIPAHDLLQRGRTSVPHDAGKPKTLAPVLSNNGPVHLSSPATTATVVVSPMSSAISGLPRLVFRPPPTSVQSRGCSPIIFEDAPTSPSPSSSSANTSSSSRKRKLCTIGVQTCDSLLPVIKADTSLPSPHKRLLLHKGSQTLQSPGDISALNPLSVQCPDIDAADPLNDRLEVKVSADKSSSYNPFTDPQILQAADGLELLSTLAEKRPKCSSLDDPKRIFPSPSDSFKSDSASVVAMEDTLSPSETELKSGQCTPRRDPRRDLSPKWTLPKKEVTSLPFADFKTPPVSGLDMEDALEVHARLAEVQRRYKEKAKELAKLQNKRPEEGKPSKRGPGRPPKKKSPEKRSDDDSSSSSSKVKDKEAQHQQQKKKRPAEELVDRVFRKLPPVKPNKVSRSIHYVKSKTGPFFKRKPASSSAKKNKDLFGYDESTWPSFTEAKHKKKSKEAGWKDPSMSKPARSADYVERRGRPPKSRAQKPPVTTAAVTVKSEPSTVSSHDSGLGMLARFALTSPPAGAPPSSSSTSSLTSPLTSPLSASLTPSPLSAGTSGLTTNFPTTATTSSITSSSNSSSSSSSNNNAYSTTSGIYSNSNSISSTASGYHSIMSGTLSGPSHPHHPHPHHRSAPAITFGSSFLTTTDSDHISFSSTITSSNNSNNNSNSNNAVATTVAASKHNSISSSSAPMNSLSGFTSSLSSHAPSNFTATSSSSAVPMATGSSLGSASKLGQDKLPLSSSSTSMTSSAATLGEEPLSNENSTSKRKQDEDSDTDTSDSSPNKKRKPGRPRKINTNKTSGGTETIWAKKSNNLGMLQLSETGSSTDVRTALEVDTSSSLKPLFVDDEWSRRRSERIFLSEPSPQPSPSLSPRGEPIWKLSNFIPKNTKKAAEANKANKDAKLNSKDVKMEASTAAVSTPDTKTSQAKPTSVPTSGKAKVTVASISEEYVKEISASPRLTASVSTPDTSMVKSEPGPSGLSSSSSSSASGGSSSSPSKSTAKKKKVNNTAAKAAGKNLGKGKGKKGKVTKSSSSSSGPSESSSASSVESTSASKERRAQENSKMKLQKAKSLHDLTQRVKKKFNKPSKKQVEEKVGKGKTRKKKRHQSCDSSDGNSSPLSSVKDRPPTPEPRSCVIEPSDLRDGLRVLYLNDGLFYEGAVRDLQPPDVYGVLTAGQRGSRPHILSLEEILKDAVIDVRPGSLRYLKEGTRVCAFWSQQFSCLYPGTVAKTSPNPHNTNSVNVEFDDGDSGRIPINHIRLLPPDFPIIEYEPDPLENLKSEKKRRRTESDASDVKKAAEEKKKSGNKRKVESDSDEKDEGEDDEEEEEEDTSSEDSGSEDLGKPWVWCGKSTKRPGMKGRARKEFYKAISRGKMTLSVGDSAVFISTTKTSHPYIGKIVSLWESHNGKMKVKVSWFYHPEETKGGKRIGDPKNALFESPHGDENDVQTIAYKCEVLSRPAYKRYVAQRARKGKSPRNTFYLAGFYDPSVNIVKYEPGVL
ncbi:serine-rich adhesin for platelets [Aplysia californica]|uniref:Serine-rich adhesin for platelets n=1 Tax=Aplysia californica TaxID=6500 RepID=A0ABM1A320_APLCA|nr:serine-rich adhesin for platelets [Aplysia californica]